MNADTLVVKYDRWLSPSSRFELGSDFVLIPNPFGGETWDGPQLKHVFSFEPRPRPRP